ncbi:protein translocase subunit SecF [Cumulibacter manganitolerans]|uniref:protein translocase subunit SecF n=1 Tax=Cumulibacter manganitolerans TaxID=1884992 RepID=UPI001297E937|nr:protein translocase subunit SecF [Cumulibacter manganitolerans]
MSTVTDDATSEPSAALVNQHPKKGRGSFVHRLYTGEAGFDFIGRRRIFYVISLLLVVGSIALIGFKGMNFGIDFAGGNTFEVPAAASDQNQATAVVQKGLDKANASLGAGAEPAQIASTQVVGSGSGTSILVKTSVVQPATATAIADDLASTFRPEIEKRLTAAGTPITDQAVRAQVSSQAIDATWGGDVSRKAVWALVVFLVAVSVFLRFRYRSQLVIGALTALLHDLVVTAGLYALVGFEVTPATVIGMLTILGFSLYDTVVVFDKVDENTRPLLAGSRMTYSEAANLAVNQTLMRSVNTSVISLLPVAALLFVGAGILGVGTLKDLALVLLVGMAAGAYSSIFLAAPIAADLTERRPEYVELTRKVAARRARGATRKAGKPSRKSGARAKSRADAAESATPSADVLDEPDGAAGPGDAVAQEPEQGRARRAGGTPRPGAKPQRDRKKR